MRCRKEWFKRLLKDAFVCNHCIYRDAELCSGQHSSSRNRRKVRLWLGTGIANGSFFGGERQAQITGIANNGWSAKRSWITRHPATVRLMWNWRELCKQNTQSRIHAAAYSRGFLDELGAVGAGTGHPHCTCPAFLGLKTGEHWELCDEPGWSYCKMWPQWKTVAETWHLTSGKRETILNQSHCHIQVFTSSAVLHLYQEAELM